MAVKRADERKDLKGEKPCVGIVNSPWKSMTVTLSNGAECWIPQKKA